MGRLSPACLARATAIYDSILRQTMWRRLDIYAVAGKKFDTVLLSIALRQRFGSVLRSLQQRVLAQAVSHEMPLSTMPWASRGIICKRRAAKNAR